MHFCLEVLMETSVWKSPEEGQIVVTLFADHSFEGVRVVSLILIE